MQPIPTVGKPFRAGALLTRAGADRRLMMDAIGLAVAGLLPPDYRGVYEREHEFPEARAALHEARASS